MTLFRAYWQQLPTIEKQWEILVAVKGIEPSRSKAPADFESAASASSATPPWCEDTTFYWQSHILV
jgi:hypothetical protein